MKDIIRFILKLVQNPIVLAILWFGVAIRGFWVSWTEGLANNYLIFSRSFFHALEQTPLYVEYPKEYFDLFLKYNDLFNKLNYHYDNNVETILKLLP